MKAILVLDEMPEQCDDCVFCQGGDWLSYLCGLTGEEFEFVNGERKDFCLLKPMPHKDFEFEAEAYQTEEEYNAYVDGWNDCLEEITGETE